MSRGLPPHPVTQLTEDLYSAQRAITRLIHVDGVVTPEETQIVQIMTRLHDEAATYEARRVAAAAYERNGDTRYVRQLAARAGGWSVLDGGQPSDPEAA